MACVFLPFPIRVRPVPRSSVMIGIDNGGLPLRMIMITIMEKDVENYLANMVRFMRPAEVGVRVV